MRDGRAGQHTGVIDGEQDQDNDLGGGLAARVIAGVFMVLVIAAVFLVFFMVRICDQQLASTGQVATVCRHPQITDPPIVALGIVLLGFLGFFFSEISGFGFTLKRTVAAVNRTARSAAQVADEAREKVDETADDLAEGVKVALGRARPAGSLTDEMADPVRRLAARYNEIRWTMPSGPERTGEMTAVMREMIEVLRGDTDFDVAANLQSQDNGLRLAALAFLSANPDPRWAGELAQAALAEDKPFNAYWAFRTLRQILAGHCDALDEVTRRRLEQGLSRLRSGSDRARQITQLLRDCPD